MFAAVLSFKNGIVLFWQYFCQFLSVPLLLHSMGQIIKSLMSFCHSVILSVCL